MREHRQKQKGKQYLPLRRFSLAYVGTREKLCKREVPAQGAALQPAKPPF